MSWMKTLLDWYDPPPPPDPLDRIVRTVETSAWQQANETAALRARLDETIRAMNSYHRAIVALQTENRQMRAQVAALQDRVTDIEFRQEEG